MIDSRMLYKKDLETPEYVAILKNIFDADGMLYDGIMSNINANPVVGIRDDVLRLIQERVNEVRRFAKDSSTLAWFIRQTNNSTVGSDWYAWILDHATWIEEMSIDNFSVLFDQILEFQLSVEDFTELYEESNDFYDLLTAIQNFDTEKYADEKPAEQEDDAEDKEVVASFQDETVEKQKSNEIVHAQSVKPEVKEPDVSHIFDNILTVMSKDDANASSLSMQNKLSSMLSNLQDNITELSNFAYEMIHNWNNERQEMERMRALFQLQQQVLASQSTKLNEMRNLLNQKDEEIRESMQRDMEHEELAKKIAELNSLSEKTSAYPRVY